jgi:hypothetical protein
MAINSSGPVRLGGTVTGESVAVEIGGSGTSTISLNDAAVRQLIGVASGTISLGSARGQATYFEFTKTITTDTANYNLYQDMVNNGWNQSKKVNATVTIAVGAWLYASDTSQYALYISNIPANSLVTIINNYGISGAGGYGGGGNGGSGYNQGVAYPGYAPGAGGNAMYIASPITMYNNNFIAGGGGGGGGQLGGNTGGKVRYPQGGQGGGGGQGYVGGAAGAGGTNNQARNGSAGSPGTINGGGSPNGGSWGSVGGATSYSGGGAAGYYVVGNGNVTWAATGTMLGSVA